MMTREEFQDMITEEYGTIKICGIEFDAGRILRELDPVAFAIELAARRIWEEQNAE